MLVIKFGVEHLDIKEWHEAYTTDGTPRTDISQMETDLENSE